MIDYTKKPTNKELEYKTFLYDWCIAFLILLLISIISFRPIIWAEEESKLNESRKQMIDIGYALKCYHKLTGVYTDDKALLFETIMNVRDTLVANPNLWGKKNIYLSCSYDAEFIQDSVIGSIKKTILDLTGVEKKDRLSYIDKTVYDMTKFDEGKYTREYIVPEISDLKNIPDLVPIIQTDYTTNTVKYESPTQDILDSIYSNSSLLRFVRNDCQDTARVDIPVRFSFMLDTLFSSSTIVSESVTDTIYTLKEPIDANMNTLQTSYVKNQYLFKYIPLNEYDSLWNFGIPVDSISLNGKARSLDKKHLNKLISDTTYKITYIDNEEFDETEEQASNQIIRQKLSANIWKVIECNMNGCLNCDWIESEGCIKKEEEDDLISGSNESSDISDDEWNELFADYEDVLQNEMQFGDSLIVEYSYKARYISNIEIIDRVLNLEDYDRKRYDLNSKLFFCPISKGEYTIELFGNKIYDIGEEFIDVKNKDVYDDGEVFIDILDGYRIISPTKNNYKENRYIIFSFKPGSPGSIENDEVTWDSKPKWNFPLK